MQFARQEHKCTQPPAAVSAESVSAPILDLRLPLGSGLLHAGNSISNCASGSTLSSTDEKMPSQATTGLSASILTRAESWSLAVMHSMWTGKARKPTLRAPHHDGGEEAKRGRRSHSFQADILHAAQCDAAAELS